jgi:hypothetical protein
MTPEQALQLIKQGEGQRVEFKSGFAEENKAIESLCAFTHADGGTVLFGVSPNGRIAGVSLGENTLEGFSNKLKVNTQPPLTPTIYALTLDGKEVVAVTIPRAGQAQLFYAFNVPYVRVGKTNQVMSPDQQRARLEKKADAWSEERDRPRFEVISQGVDRLETAFAPHFGVRQVSGDPVANLEWRIRGPRFPMDWRPASGSALARTHFVSTFDLTAQPREADIVGLDEMAFEIRFHWRGQWRHELHRWPISRRQLPQKVLWDVGAERLPPLYIDGRD